MNSRRRKLLNYGLILVTLLIVLVVGISGQEMSGAMNALRSIGPVWVMACLLAWAVSVLCDAVSIRFYLRRQGYRISLLYAGYVAIAGNYYSNVTPGATGGQPMQIYYLSKKGVPIGIGTSALIVQFFSFQFMLAVWGTVLWIAFRDFIAEQVGGNTWILVVGYGYNIFSVGIILLMALNRRIVWFIIRLIIRLLTKLRIVKDPEAQLVRWQDHLETFHTSIMTLGRAPASLVVMLVSASVKLFSLMAVIAFVYHAFHMQGAALGELIALGVMLYTSAAYTPLPGASGAQEGIFSLYFAQIFPDGVRLMALLLWRFFTYYISLIVGAVAITWGTIRTNRRKDRKKASPTP